MIDLINQIQIRNVGLRTHLSHFVQGGLRAFTPLCEAIVSWRQIQCEGLSNEIVQLMQLYKQNLAPVRFLSHKGAASHCCG